MQKRLGEAVTRLRQDIGKVDEPQLAAMFEISAEVLKGLVKAFDEYEKKNEAAWLHPAPLLQADFHDISRSGVPAVGRWRLFAGEVMQ
jgi:hypothetical protein